VFQLLSISASLASILAAALPGLAQQAVTAPNGSVGIRKITSRHLELYTDLPSDPAVDDLPAVFDKAVPLWADYFGIDRAKTAGWQARAYLINERRRFDALGLMPPDGNDQFTNGISMGSTLWFYDQPTAYYRRHLLLHEGTHAFMVTFLGGCGPGWFMEGTAELLATHRLDETGRLTLGVMPRNRAEVPMLGRIKLIQDARKAGRTLSFPAVMRISNDKQLENEPYAWCWAAAKWLDEHPRYRDRFRHLKQYVQNPDFNDIVRRDFGDDWGDLLAEWQACIATLDHGYDFQRMAIEFDRGSPLDDAGRSVTIAADRGWQSSGVRLSAGKSYRITATGRYQIAHDGQPWPCEPGGVTIDYHDGRPLGMLLAAVDGRTMGATLADMLDIGLEATITPAASGTLYLRVNDSAGRLNDNRGTLTVTIAYP
jgi:hypothetical protein